MNRSGSFLFWLSLFMLALSLLGCAGAQGEPGPVGPAGVPGPIGPVGPAGEDATASQEYIGSDQCGECHEAEYSKFTISGHPYVLTKIENDQPPTFPFDSQTGGVVDSPEGTTWADISYVIGGYGWKARFIDKEGYIITGDENAMTQYNFAHEKLEVPAGWVAYHAGDQNLSYDCGVCHTTGYAPQGHQDGMDGILGTWEFEGIQCERCHGPGSRHAEDPMGVQMVVDRSSQLCGKCHTRDNPALIDAGEGFELNYEQYEDLYNSKHFAISCITCHDPHASTLYADEEVNPDKSVKQQCESCHWAQLIQKNRLHGSVECTNCHMPPMAQSAVGDLERFTSDIHSHQFSINPDPMAPQFSEDGTYVMPYITLDYACRHCHNGEDWSNQETDALADMALDYHARPTATPVSTPTAEAAETPESAATATPEDG